MSHGRFPTWSQRAPCEALSDVSRHCADANPFRIGPSESRSVADWHELGVGQEQRGDVSAAIESYSAALRAGGPDAQIAFDLAYALAETGQIDRALERYRQVIEIDPTRADAWTNLGDLLIEVGQRDAGLAALRQALRLEPNDAAVQYNLADALDGDDPRSAAVHWRAFLQAGGGSPEHHLYARCRLRRINASRINAI